MTTLLFDLDGTLLDIDMPAFLKAYFSLAGRRFVSPPELPRLTPALAAAARKMAAYRAGTHTLDRVFLEAFSPAVKRPPIEVRGVFTAFHRAEFEQLRRLTAPRPAARPLLERALALGYELAIATNPVFFLEAIRARIRWAGLEGIPFTLVTCAEIMRCAKPHRHYFTQTLRLLGRRADECLMIGDNPGMDLPAGLLGIGTWLVIPEPEECLEVAGADLRGTLEELAGWLDARGVAVGCRHAGSGLRRYHDGTGFDAGNRRGLCDRGMGPPHVGLHPPEPAPGRTHEAALQRVALDPDHAGPRGAALREHRVRVHLSRFHFHRRGEQHSHREARVVPRRICRSGDTFGPPPDCQADIYSMGVVLFELLTGTLKTVGQKRPAELHADIPPWLDELILRCMAKDLKKRYRTTDEVSAALMKLKGAGPG